MQMSTDKEFVVPTCSSHKRKYYSAERASKIKLKRRERYAQLPLEKKELFLSQRRSKNLKSVSSCLFFTPTNEAFHC